LAGAIDDLRHVLSTPTPFSTAPEISIDALS